MLLFNEELGQNGSFRIRGNLLNLRTAISALSSLFISGKCNVLHAPSTIISGILLSPWQEPNIPEGPEYEKSMCREKFY